MSNAITTLPFGVIIFLNVFFSSLSYGNVLCTGRNGNACVIYGSEKTLRKYLQIAKKTDIDKIIIEKTRSCVVLRGILIGGPYSIDEEAY